MELARDPGALERLISGWGGAPRIGSVRIAGDLHDGHAALIAAARGACDRVIVTCFDPALIEAELVEPGAGCTPGEGDAGRLEALGCDLLFAPGVEALFPAGFATRVRTDLHRDILCAAMPGKRFEPALVLALKIWNLTRAAASFHGEKDWQFLRLLERVAGDLNHPVTLVPVPTARAGDGLAEGRRNRRLDPAQRKVAPALHTALAEATTRIAAGEPTELVCAEAQEALFMAGFTHVDYLECRDAASLRLAPSPGRGARVFASAWLGDTRLIDTLAVPG